MIDQYLAAGNYSLVVESTGGAGSLRLDDHAVAGVRPVSTHPGGVRPDAIVAGDFTGDGRTDLAVANSM